MKNGHLRTNAFVKMRTTFDGPGGDFQPGFGEGWAIGDVKARTELGMLVDVTFHLREDAADAKLTDLLEVHVVELRKLKAQSMGMEWKGGWPVRVCF